MSDEQEIAYYRKRAETERWMALEAGRSDVAAIHWELAKQYQALVDRIELRDALKSAAPSPLGKAIAHLQVRQIGKAT